MNCQNKYCSQHWFELDCCCFTCKHQFENVDMWGSSSWKSSDSNLWLPVQTLPARMAPTLQWKLVGGSEQLLTSCWHQNLTSWINSGLIPTPSASLSSTPRPLPAASDCLLLTNCSSFTPSPSVLLPLRRWYPQTDARIQSDSLPSIDSGIVPTDLWHHVAPDSKAGYGLIFHYRGGKCFSYWPYRL